MQSMFYNASLFNQDLGNWNVGNVINMVTMLTNSGLNTNNYNSLLTGWTGWIGGTATKSLKSNVPFSVGTTKYSSGTTANDARNYLVTGKTWTITDGGGI
jgi:surface protein